MMEQFQAAKREAQGALLFFRMGDFYELFGEDAVVASRELGIALTSRSKGADAMPMAGVPVRAYEGYLIKLVRKGFRVAICEQLEDPREARGIVDRGLVRIVTAGTITEEEALDARENNYLAAVHEGHAGVGLAWVDLSTGRFRVSEPAPAAMRDELARLRPAEILCSDTWKRANAALASELGARVSERDDWRFEPGAARRRLLEHFRVATLAGFGLADDSAAVPAAGALIEYLRETQKSACAHVRSIERVEQAEHLVLDRATRACLELVATQRSEPGRDAAQGTLLSIVDATLTPMGGRLLREWLLAPLRRVERILDRQRGVAELAAEPFLREELREQLGRVLDLERLAAKVSTGRASPRDLGAIAGSLALVPELRARLSGRSAEVLGRLHDRLDPLDELVARARATLVDAPPLSSREGGIVRPGFSAELDELRGIAGDGKSAMARFQAAEIQRTGIAGLKVGFTSVFGYYIEVPRGQLARVPSDYQRRQTVKNAERFATPELKEFEAKVLQSEERARSLELEVFQALCQAVAAEIQRVLETAQAIAELDALAGLAEVAARQRYVAPEIDDGDAIEIREGRHPVIERSPTCPSFVPNDGLLDLSERRLTILTGPNMAGKSTYIRQTALIVLLAQMGSFVPAASARIGVCDRIFTRVGAGDDISRGASTFLVEMVEIANILNHASERSLVILDEVGRGTSTFDGLALAWAIAEHLSQKVRARALFATHYHQLTELGARYPGVVNMSVAVREWGDEIVFLHRIVEGGTDRSYGIHVARLAGVPGEVVERARTILRDLEEDAAGLAPRIAAEAGAPGGLGAPQAELYAPRPSELEQALRAIDVERLSPIDALLKLAELKALSHGSGSAPAGESERQPGAAPSR